jgi:hypothetical protein
MAKRYIHIRLSCWLGLAMRNLASLLTIFLIFTIVCGCVLVASLDLDVASAATEFSGIISSDTTWTQANSPYTLTGNVLIANGATLTIEAGTTVNLGSYYIQVNGTLRAIGTSANPIIFNDGKITFTEYSANWTESTGAGCTIQNATLSDSALIIKSSVSISNNTILLGSNKIQLEGGSPKICTNVIIPDDIGISISRGAPFISGNVINAPELYRTGISVLWVNSATSSPTISQNIISHCHAGILWMPQLACPVLQIFLKI